MNSEKLVFESSVEAMFVISLRDRTTPELKEALRAVGIDIDKKLPPAIPRDAWYAGIEMVARHAWKELPREEALRAMGRRLIENLQHTLLGKAFGPVMRLLGPERLLKRVPHNMKSANNFATATVEVKSPREVVIEASDVGNAPELFAGTLEGLLHWAGEQVVAVSFQVTTPPAARYVVRWGEGLQPGGAASTKGLQPGGAASTKGLQPGGAASTKGLQPGGAASTKGLQPGGAASTKGLQPGGAASARGPRAV